MYVMELPFTDALRDLLAADPYFTTEDVTIVRTHAWSPFIG